MDLAYLELVLQDFTLKQLSMINWFNNNVDGDIEDRYSKILDLLRQSTDEDLKGWTALKIQQGLLAVKELGFLTRREEKELGNKLKNYCVSKEIANNFAKPYIDSCCGNDLEMISGRNIVVFGVNYSYASKTMIGICKKCHIRYGHNFFSHNNEKIVTRKAFANDDIVYFGGDYAYERPFIKLLTNSIIYLYSGFENFTKCFNATKNSSSTKFHDTSSLSPTRIQDFWFIYNYVACSFFYTEKEAIKIPFTW